MFNPVQVVDKVLESQNIYSFFLKPYGDRRITDLSSRQLDLAIFFGPGSNYNGLNGWVYVITDARDKIARAISIS